MSSAWVAPDAAGRLDNSHVVDLTAEVALIQRLVEDRLVQALQLCQRELFTEQLKADSGVSQLAAQALTRESPASMT